MLMEQSIRLTVFVCVLTVVALWEIGAPRRPLLDDKRRRWSTNLSLIVVDTVLLRLLFPIMPIALAQLAAARGWGILAILQMPPLYAGILSFILLDFIIYIQHVLFHHLPILWRLHRMHHSDLDLDVTSGNRFHPLEMMVSLLIKLAAIVSLGVQPEVVLAFEVVLNASAMFNHGNIRLPLKWDRLFRLALVTPDMHRVHHSTIVRETNSNFGFNFPWWDYLCGTYRAQPEKGHLQMNIGLTEYRDPKKLTLLPLLIQPFTAP
jgi:sterol desaturase/sphingolipid hydroxylase (fatty acid hydroxylase superfamily)